ncbi:DUF2516 family protein [Streptomyces johnsoniae]|uniref:DUF2516 family protein n=1 Tax=Streptomyces johnsoniae TaxID=3075532 RepID=A0ABU2S3C1_9ACTN|nr:DUF2516 family protein [Streptomyces sp. DSM 41886]MDT0442095.1 DUF2516 family protein [Streptomyces sp. DSM 41886]
MLLQGFSSIVSFIFLGLLILSVYALVNAALQREDAYRAADKQTKPFWLVILGVTVAVQLLIPWLLLVLAGAIATIVYLVDVRPALQSVSGGRRGGRSSSSDGPYGPYNGGR